MGTKSIILSDASLNTTHFEKQLCDQWEGVTTDRVNNGEQIVIILSGAPKKVKSTKVDRAMMDSFGVKHDYTLQ